MMENFLIGEDELNQKIENLSPNPTSLCIEELAKNIVASPSSAEKKRGLFGKVFDKVRSNEILEAVLNLWTIAVMLEHSDPPFPMKIDSARQLLQDSKVTDRMLNEWVEYVWIESTQIEEDMLAFLAMDFRNKAKDRLDANLLVFLNSSRFYH